jgi:hypothetical protein
MNCPKCGAQLLPGAVFCGSCGHRLEAGNPPRAAAAQASQGAGFSQGHGIHIDEDSRGQGGGYKYEVLHQPA